MRIKLMLAIASFIVAATTNAMFVWRVPARDLGIPRDGHELVGYLEPQDSPAKVLPYVTKVQYFQNNENKDYLPPQIEQLVSRMKELLKNDKYTDEVIKGVDNLSDPMDVYMFLAALERDDTKYDTKYDVDALDLFLITSFNPGKSYVKRIADTAKAAAGAIKGLLFRSRAAETVGNAQGEGAGPNLNTKANVLKAIAQETTWIARLVLIMIVDSEGYSISSTKVLDHIERMLPSFEGEVDGATVSEGNDLVFTGKKVLAESTPRAQRSLRCMKACLMLFLGSTAEPGKQEITLDEIKKLISEARDKAKNTTVSGSMINTLRSLASLAEYDPNDSATMAGYNASNVVDWAVSEFTGSANKLWNAAGLREFDSTKEKWAEKTKNDRNNLIEIVKAIIETGLGWNPDYYQQAAYSLVSMRAAVQKIKKELEQSTDYWWKQPYFQQAGDIMDIAFHEVISKLLNSWIIANVLVNQDLFSNYNPSKQLPLNYQLKRLLSAWYILDTDLEKQAMPCIMEVIEIILRCIDQKAEVTIGGEIMNISNALELIKKQENPNSRYKLLRKFVQNLQVAADPKKVHEKLNEKLKSVYADEIAKVKGGEIKFPYTYPNGQWSQKERVEKKITISYTLSKLSNNSLQLTWYEPEVGLWHRS